MRKFITISFLGIYLFGNTEIGQLANLPKLITHYHQHQYLQPDVSFSDFVVMHYWGDDGVAFDDQEDQELPFKQVHKPFSNINFEVPSLASFNSNSTTFISNSFMLLNEPNTQTGFFALPLQPPEQHL